MYAWLTIFPRSVSTKLSKHRICSYGMPNRDEKDIVVHWERFSSDDECLTEFGNVIRAQVPNSPRRPQVAQALSLPGRDLSRPVVNSARPNKPKSVQPKQNQSQSRRGPGLRLPGRRPRRPRPRTTQPAIAQQLVRPPALPGTQLTGLQTRPALKPNPRSSAFICGSISPNPRLAGHKTSRFIFAINSTVCG